MPTMLPRVVGVPHRLLQFVSVVGQFTQLPLEYFPSIQGRQIPNAVLRTLPPLQVSH